ncbi:hypothetical protein [Pseudactinotalea suaedae]|uniref:hypothetical protein n=1 Tax=Pseudactinotalea suaedae TaxID=1524924 RepID=UPI0012E0F1AA|nr:hypothetical protein [Pseudactinotalea suaedae]
MTRTHLDDSPDGGAQSASSSVPTPVDRSAQENAAIGRATRIVIRTLSILVLSAALPAMLVSEVVDVGRSEAWIVTLVIMIWAGLRLSLLWVGGTPRLFDFFFWLFVYIFMGIAPTAQMRSGLIATTTPGMDNGFDMITAGVVALGVVCYEVGRLAWIAREHVGHRVRSAEVRLVSTFRSVAMFGVALVLSAYVLSKIGATALLGSREASAAAKEAAWPDPAMREVIFASGIYPLLVSVGALAQIRRTAFSAINRRRAGLAALFGAFVLLMIVNPVASARYTFGTVAFALAAFAGAVATRRRARLTMLAVIGGFLFVFPIADAFRRADGTASRAGFFAEYLGNADYDAFWQISNSLSFWIDGLVVPGRQLLGSVLFWVPRSLWPSKPTGTGSLLAEYRGYSFDNLSAPMWAEAVVNGGVVAVVIVFLILGAVLRAMDTRIIPALAQGGVWALAGAIFPVYMTILLRGSLLQATGALALTIACILAVRGAHAARDAHDVAGAGTEEEMPRPHERSPVQ